MWKFASFLYCMEKHGAKTSIPVLLSMCQSTETCSASERDHRYLNMLTDSLQATAHCTFMSDGSSTSLSYREWSHYSMEWLVLAQDEKRLLCIRTALVLVSYRVLYVVRPVSICFGGQCIVLLFMDLHCLWNTCTTHGTCIYLLWFGESLSWILCWNWVSQYSVSTPCRIFVQVVYFCYIQILLHFCIFPAVVWFSSRISRILFPGECFLCRLVGACKCIW